MTPPEFGRLPALAVALLVAGTLFGCPGGGAKERDQGPRSSKREAPPITVALAPVERRTLAEVLELTGTLEAGRQVAIAPRVAGTLVAVDVGLGDAVRRGQVIARLDDRESAASLAGAAAGLAAARAALSAREVDARHLDLQARRDRELFKGDLIARQDVEASQARLAGARAQGRQAQAEVARQQAAWREASEAGSRTQILAPMSGVIGVRHLDPGAVVSQATPIVTLIGQGSPKIMVQIPEAAIPRLRSGMPATVRVEAWPDRVFVARVVRVAPVIDPATRTGPVELLAADPKGLLRPGMFARVTLTTGVHSQAASVPLGALARLDGHPGVFVFTANQVKAEERRGESRPPDGLAQFVPIRTGIVTERYAELLEGPPPGARVMTLGSHLLKDGAAVQLAEEPAKQGRGRRRESP